MAERFARVLVVDLLGGLGDLVLVLPAIHALAAHHPAAELRVLTHSPADELLSADPAVHRTVLSARGGEAGAVAAQLREFAPDLVVSTTRHSGIPALLAASGARVVDDLWRHPPPCDRVDDRYLSILRAERLISDAPADAAIALTDAEVNHGERAVGVTEPAVVLLPEAGMAVKQWPMTHWAALALELNLLGVPVFGCGREPVELPGARTLPPASLRGIAGYFAAIGRAGGVAVGADTGPLRVAAATGCATVGLFGPTTAQRYGLSGGANLQGLPECPHRTPLAISEAPCWWSGECPLRAEGPACLADITVGAVRSAVLDVLAAC